MREEGGGRKSFISPRVISALDGKSGEKTFLSVPKIGEKNVRKRERDCCNEARFASHISSPFFSLVPFMKLLWAHSRKNILSSAGCYLLDLASVLGICTNPFHLHRGRESGGEFCQEKDLVERAGEGVTLFQLLFDLPLLFSSFSVPFLQPPGRERELFCNSLFFAN